ncbi:MAG: carboxylesterase family protein [Bacteroidales bacterium]|nr:carboxylesterase family protein [Bacteroidales bacterium]
MKRRMFFEKTMASIPAIMLAGHVNPLFANILSIKNGDTLDAETVYGKVRGYEFNGVKIFRGIPYGGLTEGEARFLPPSKPIKWTGIKDCATANGARCVQAPSLGDAGEVGSYFVGGRQDYEDLYKQTDSENCLNLNVLTPSLSGRRPVMVYIHGGGFDSGSGVMTVLGDKHVKEQDVVLVGINHRLNVFGFTYLGGLSEKYAIGNPGMLDLVAALEWVRDNIENFGGDPGNVMIFGESGGGAKISTLLAMPAASGLFHNAAIQSGSMLQAIDAQTAATAAKELMQKVGITKVEDIHKVPSADLFKAGISGGVLGPGPVIDGHTLLRHPWDPESPELSADIPLIVGCDKDESTLFALANQKLYNLDDAGLKEELIKAEVPENKVDNVISLYKRAHPNESPSDLYFRISTDRGVRWKATRQAELHLARGQANVFMYYFQWNTPLLDGNLRAFHTADLPLTMRLTYYPESVQLSKQLSGAWAAFARDSDPSHQGLKWPAYTLEDRHTMVFDIDKSQAVKDPHQEERIFMNDNPSSSFL